MRIARSLHEFFTARRTDLNDEKFARSSRTLRTAKSLRFVLIDGKLFTATLAVTCFDTPNTSSVTFETPFRTVAVVAGVIRFVFLAADDTLEQLFSGSRCNGIVTCMQFSVLRAGHDRQVGDIVVGFVAVNVMNNIAVGNFAMIVSPDRTVQCYDFEKMTIEVVTPAIDKTIEFLMIFVDLLNLEPVAINFFDEVLDGGVLERSFDGGAQLLPLSRLTRGTGVVKISEQPPGVSQSCFTILSVTRQRLFCKPKPAHHIRAKNIIRARRARMTPPSLSRVEPDIGHIQDWRNFDVH